MNARRHPFQGLRAPDAEKMEISRGERGSRYRDGAGTPKQAGEQAELEKRGGGEKKRGKEILARQRKKSEVEGSDSLKSSSAMRLAMFIGAGVRGTPPSGLQLPFTKAAVKLPPALFRPVRVRGRCERSRVEFHLSAVTGSGLRGSLHLRQGQVTSSRLQQRIWTI